MATKKLYAMTVNDDSLFAGEVQGGSFGEGWVGLELYDALMLVGAAQLCLSGELKRFKIEDVRVFNDPYSLAEAVFNELARREHRQ